MSVKSLNEFQQLVSELLLRHRSLLDVLSKQQQASASVNRAVVKAVTECGCIELNATKQQFKEEHTAESMHKHLESHLSGTLCEHCEEVISEELGQQLFYISALCNSVNINLQDVVQKETEKCSTLGFFNLS